MQRNAPWCGWGIALVTLIGASAAWAVDVGDKPVINWKTTDNTPVTNEALKGRIIIVDFWATWCGPCMAEADHMVALSKQYGPKGVALLGISLDNSAAKMASVAKEKGFTWPQVCSGKAWQDPIAVAWGVNGIPSTFILGPDGAILWHGHPATIDAPLAKIVEKYPTSVLLAQQAAASIDAAGKLLDQKDYDQALATLDKLADTAWKDRQLDAPLRKFAARLKPAPGPAAGSAEDKDKIQAALSAHADTAAKLTKLVPALGFKATPGTGGGTTPGTAGGTTATGGAATPAPAPPSTQPAAALVDAKLKAADQAREAGRHVEAYGLYQWLVQRAADSPAGQTAAAHVKKYEADEAFMAQYKKAQAQETARGLLGMAKNYEAAQRPDLAKEQYQKIVTSYPDTPAATEAKAALERLK